jgi:crotonobetainyl-CoA:carnitine CoA-transferase CaiB-like acyl-CoA transferase
MVQETEGPGNQKIKILGNPLKFDKTPADTFTPPPRLGENTREILSNILGYPAKRIEELEKKEAIKSDG